MAAQQQQVSEVSEQVAAGVEAEAANAALAATIDQATAASQESVRQRYLFPFIALGAVQNHVRTQGIATARSRIDEITAAWLALQPAIQQMQIDEAGLARSIQIGELSAEHAGVLEAIAANPFFKKTFQQAQHAFAVVEIDKMIATQRQINLDYVARLRDSFTGQLDMARLIEICLSPDSEPAPLKHLELSSTPAVHAFTSENADLRFLGSNMKELVPEDLTLAEQGGVPVMALISFIGFGASSINAFFDVARNRVILNNGYHRVYALRSIGVTHIPIVLMISHNEAMHLPPIFPGGVPKDYVLNTPRPSLVVDLFRDDLTVELQVKKRIKKVIVQVSNADHDVPV